MSTKIWKTNDVTKFFLQFGGEYLKNNDYLCNQETPMNFVNIYARI